MAQLDMEKNYQAVMEAIKQHGKPNPSYPSDMDLDYGTKEQMEVTDRESRNTCQGDRVWWSPSDPEEHEEEGNEIILVSSSSYTENGRFRRSRCVQGRKLH